MQLAMIGLGRMGGNMVRRLVRDGHELVTFDQSAEAIKVVAAKGITAVKSIGEIARALAPRRVVWIMLPAGAAVDETIAQLAPELERGDIIIDGGNSNYRDSMRRA